MKKSFCLKTFFLLCIGFFLTACNKKQPENYLIDNMDLNVQETENSDNSLLNTQSTFIHYNNGDNKVICVLLGYGFSEGQTYSRIYSMLGEKFGFAQNGGLILPVIFPDDLKNRIMNLSDFIEPYNIGGIILLGAPENTHYTIARIQDSWEQECPFEVFSFFPQDDILGQEATCTIVFDNEHPLHDDEPLQEHEFYVDEDFDKILENSIRYITGLPGPLPHDKTLENHVKNIMGTRQFKHHTDSETGLQALNHFVLIGETAKK